MRSLGQEPSQTELEDILNEIDKDGSGSIEFDEFLSMMGRKVQQADSESELRAAFAVFDRDNSGTISAEELRNVMKSIGENLSDSEIDEMIKEADANGDGNIDCEFARVNDEKVRTNAIRRRRVCQDHECLSNVKLDSMLYLFFLCKGQFVQVALWPMSSRTYDSTMRRLQKSGRMGGFGYEWIYVTESSGQECGNITYVTKRQQIRVSCDMSSKRRMMQGLRAKNIIWHTVVLRGYCIH
jgi:uncharacterized protein YneF (UPF0154 family)